MSNPSYEYDFNKQRTSKPMRKELYWRYQKRKAPTDQDKRNGPVIVGGLADGNWKPVPKLPDKKL